MFNQILIHFYNTYPSSWFLFITSMYHQRLSILLSSESRYYHLYSVFNCWIKWFSQSGLYVLTLRSNLFISESKKFFACPIAKEGSDILPMELWNYWGPGRCICSASTEGDTYTESLRGRKEWRKRVPGRRSAGRETCEERRSYYSRRCDSGEAQDSSDM